MENDKHIGLVLWWSEIDQNGIILGIDKKEYYFDSSVIFKKFKRGDRVLFKINEKISDCLCAKEVGK